MPFLWVYSLVVWIRNKFFDWGILPSEKFLVPIISVGNLAIGGTGKTPHIEFLIRLLNSKYRVAVLSRGYKRRSIGFILAKGNVSAQKIGDEPFQLYCKFPDLLIAVDKNRKRGIRNLLAISEKQRPQVILLDDAFQYRFVIPSLSILLTKINCLFCDDILLPIGKLREPAKNSIRANIIICTKCPTTIKTIDYKIIEESLNLFHDQQLYFSYYKYKDLLPIFSEKTFNQSINIEQLQAQSYSFLSVVGIANPKELITYLENYTTDLHVLIYADHHYFKRRDLKKIIEKFYNIDNDNRIIIMSEKDAVRLKHNTFVPEILKPFIYYLPIEVSFTTSSQEFLFIQSIENHVENFKRNRILA